MDEKTIKKIGSRMVVLQSFADYILEVKEHKTFAEAYPDIPDEYGRLNKKQEELLHTYLTAIYAEFGLDLNKILEENGAKPKDGEILSEFEREKLSRLADEHLGVMGTLMDRKAKLFDNK